MPAGTLSDTATPPLEVRIYDHDRLLAREFCEREEDTSAVVERWSDVANLFVVAEEPSPRHRPDDTPAPVEPLIGTDDGCPLASIPQPARGTE